MSNQLNFSDINRLVELVPKPSIDTDMDLGKISVGSVCPMIMHTFCNNNEDGCEILEKACEAMEASKARVGMLFEQTNQMVENSEISNKKVIQNAMSELEKSLEDNKKADVVLFTSLMNKIK